MRVCRGTLVLARRECVVARCCMMRAPLGMLVFTPAPLLLLDLVHDVNAVFGVAD